MCRRTCDWTGQAAPDISVLRLFPVFRRQEGAKEILNRVTVDPSAGSRFPKKSIGLVRRRRVFRQVKERDLDNGVPSLELAPRVSLPYTSTHGRRFRAAPADALPHVQR